MIYLLSDLHADTDFPAFRQYLELASENDLLILLGDIGLSFEKSAKNRAFDKFFLSVNKNIAFLDGNHDNFAYLSSYPEENWHGGKVHRLSPNIVHLMRGNVYTIENKTFFTFGGCKSSPKWKDLGLLYEGEEPTQAQISTAHESLGRHGFEVDYVLTHKYEQTPSRGTVSPTLLELTRFIDKNVKYKKWYAGHWHINQKHDEKHFFVFDRLTPVI